tara:strand:+ start:4689 stop:5924 length:1236 start_codon:yes stop_codon:yes gene_type:complete
VNQFVRIQADKSLEVLDGALTELAKVERNLHQREEILGYCLENYERNRVEFSGPTGLFSRLKIGTQDVLLSLCTFGHDLELAMSRRRLGDIMGEVRLEAIEAQVDNQVLRLEPRGRIQEFPHGEFQRAGTLTLSSPWYVTIGNSRGSDIILVVQVDLNAQRGSSEVDFSTSTPVYLLNRDLSVATILKKIPVKDGHRSEAKRRLLAELKDTLAKNSSAIPNVRIPEVGRLDGFYSCVVAPHLLIFARKLPKRKTRKPYLTRVSDFWDDAVRVDKAHIEPILRRKVQEKEVSVTSIVFKNNEIEVNVHKHDSRRASHVKIETNVWARFGAWILQDRPAELFVDVYMQEWRYRYKIKRCWPKCGEIKRIVEKKLREEIDKFNHLTFPFADFRGRYRGARASNDEHAVTILLRK